MFILPGSGAVLKRSVVVTVKEMMSSPGKCLINVSQHCCHDGGDGGGAARACACQDAPLIQVAGGVGGVWRAAWGRSFQSRFLPSPYRRQVGRLGAGPEVTYLFQRSPWTLPRLPLPSCPWPHLTRCSPSAAAGEGRRDCELGFPRLPPSREHLAANICPEALSPGPRPASHPSAGARGPRPSARARRPHPHPRAVPGALAPARQARFPRV